MLLMATSCCNEKEGRKLLFRKLLCVVFGWVSQVKGGEIGFIDDGLGAKALVTGAGIKRSAALLASSIERA